MIFITADLHLGHSNKTGEKSIIKYCNRPFKSIEEHDEILIANWNSVVQPKDTVYILGDFVWKDHREYCPKMNGRKILITGSHDRHTIQREQRFKCGLVECVGYMLEIKIDGYPTTLCHYALTTWPRSHYGSWSLYAHSHGHLFMPGLSMDVGVDTNNYFPYSEECIKERMAKKEASDPEAGRRHEVIL